MVTKKKKNSTPCHKRLIRADRLQAARHWISKFEGKNIFQGYKKHFGIDLECALAELKLLQVPLDQEYVKQVRKSEESRIQARKKRKDGKNQSQIFAMDSDDNFYLIMGYTSNGFPHGITWEEIERDRKMKRGSAMRKTIQLSAIIDAIDCQLDESLAFLNIETGEVVSFSLEEYRAAEEEEELSNFPEWQQEIIHQAVDVVEHEENYIPLPTKFDINEYEIMERFCLSQTDDDIQDELYYAIKGSGAFRRFKNKIRSLDLEEKWYEFHDNAIKEIAEEWCKENSLDFI